VTAGSLLAGRAGRTPGAPDRSEYPAWSGRGQRPIALGAAGCGWTRQLGLAWRWSAATG